MEHRIDNYKLDFVHCFDFYFIGLSNQRNLNIFSAVSIYLKDSPQQMTILRGLPRDRRLR